MQRYNIDLDSLKKLRDIFGDDGEMEIDRFVEAFGFILGDNLSQQDLMHLFMKIDANSDGSVDWDEFTNYMFLNKQQDGKDGDMANCCLINENASSRFNGNCGQIVHREPAAASCYIDRSHTLLTAGKDGLVNVWNAATATTMYSFQTGGTGVSQAGGAGEQHSALKTAAATVVCDWESETSSNARDHHGEDSTQLKHMLQNIMASKNHAERMQVRGVRGVAAEIPGVQQSAASRSRHPAKDWVTSMLYVPTASKVAIGSMNNGISFYDVGLEESKCIANISPSSLQQCVPISLSFCRNNSRHREYLLVGNDFGGVQGFCVDSKHWKFMNGHLLNSFGAPIQSSFHIKQHKDHVSALEYIPDLNSLLTASLDGTINVLDLDRQVVRRTFALHQKPVYTFSWSPQYKFVASAGLNRDILIWSPYSNRLIVTLQGHSAPVLKLQVNDAKNQIYSFANDSTVKVWDTRTQRCLQTIHTNQLRILDQSTGAEGSDGPMPSGSEGRVADRGAPSANGGSRGAGPQLGDNRVKPLGNAGLMMFVPTTQQIFTCKRSLRKWDIGNPGMDDADNSEVNARVDPARKLALPLVGALYNSHFFQVTSIDVDNALQVSNIDHGTFISKFKLVEQVLDDDAAAAMPKVSLATQEAWNNETTTLFPPRKDISCLSFDDSGRRMLTGSIQSGQVKLWNFSNGCLLRRLIREPLLQGNEADGVDLPAHDGLQGDVIQKRSHAPIETTNCVMYVVCDLPKTPGCPLIQNKFIVAAGSSGKIYVWQDNVPEAESEEQGYTFCFPTESPTDDEPWAVEERGQTDRMLDDEEKLAIRLKRERFLIRAQRGHKDEITCLQFIPPSTIVSGGNDGKVVFWNINSGDVRSTVQCTGPVVAMHTVTNNAVLFVAVEHGSVCTVSTNSLKVCALFRVVPQGVSVCAMASNQTGEYCLFADTTGYLHLCAMGPLRAKAAGCIPLNLLIGIHRVRSWRGHLGRISSVSCCDNIEEATQEHNNSAEPRASVPRLSKLSFHHQTPEAMLPKLAPVWVTSSSDGSVLLWSSNGAKVGEFLNPSDTHLVPWTIPSIMADQVDCQAGVVPLSVEELDTVALSRMKKSTSHDSKQLEILLAKATAKEPKQSAGCETGTCPKERSEGENDMTTAVEGRSPVPPVNQSRRRTTFQHPSRKQIQLGGVLKSRSSRIRHKRNSSMNATRQPHVYKQKIHDLQDLPLDSLQLRKLLNKRR